MGQGSTRGTVAAVLALVGGAVVVVGSFMDWARAAIGPFGVYAKGIDGWEGKLTFVAGGALLVVGVLALTVRGQARRIVPVAGVVLGAIAMGVGIYTTLTAEDQVAHGAASEIADVLDVPIPQATAAVEQAIDTGVLTVSTEIGLVFVIVGGGLAVLAGVVALTVRAPAPPAPASGAGLTGWAAGPQPSTAAIPRSEEPSVPPLPPPPSADMLPTTGTTPNDASSPPASDGHPGS